MKRTDGFLLKYIEGVPYLLPYGQRIVEHRRNLRLNETSAYLWEILPECGVFPRNFRMCLLPCERSFRTEDAPLRKNCKKF